MAYPFLFLQPLVHSLRILSHIFSLSLQHFYIFIFQEVKKRFPDGLPLLDPIEDMNIKDEQLKKIVRKIEVLEHRMYTHPIHKDPDLDTLYNLCAKKANVETEIKNVKQNLKKAKTVIQMDELKCRKRVLRRCVVLCYKHLWCEFNSIQFYSWNYVE